LKPKQIKSVKIKTSTSMVDYRAKRQWLKARVAYNYYADYISKKPGIFDLSIVDLLFLANFKGGSATINEPPATLAPKLKAYSVGLNFIHKKFKSHSLVSLNKQELDYFCRLTDIFIQLAAKSSRPNTHIDGFGESFASALLHFHFPELAPILDKRALNGAGVPGLRVDKYNNVRNLGSLYGALIRKSYSILKKHHAHGKKWTLMQLDQDLFCRKLRKPPFK
jgi:hypothetical protein